MSRKERNIKMIKQFEVEHQRKPFDLHEVYEWATSKGLWFAPLDLAEKRFVEEVAHALREEYITAEDGICDNPRLNKGNSDSACNKENNRDLLARLSKQNTAQQ